MLQLTFSVLRLIAVLRKVHSKHKNVCSYELSKYKLVLKLETAFVMLQNC